MVRKMLLNRSIYEFDQSRNRLIFFMPRQEQEGDCTDS